MTCARIHKEQLYVPALLADETKDVSKQEQLAIVLRYVDDAAAIHEKFLTYKLATDLTAESLATYLLNTLSEYQLDPANIVSQGYDGASVMSGRCSGVQQRVRQVAPTAIYVHCCAHVLNLVLVACAKVVRSAKEFFCLLQQLYVFISTTKCHVCFKAKQKELHPDKQPLQLQALSDTRWACRYAAVNAVCKTYDSILSTLVEISNCSDAAKAVEARGILLQVRSFSFLVNLVTFDRVLCCTKSLSDQLQSVQNDLASAIDLVNATKQTLQEYRSDAMWVKIWRYANRIAEVHDIDVEYPSGTSRRRRPPKRFEETVILESVGARESLSSSEQYKRELYFPVLDAILTELSRRFDSKNVEIMCGIQACNPTSNDFLSVPMLISFAELYGFDTAVLEMEATLAKLTLQPKNLEHTSEVLLALFPLKDAFPQLTKSVRIALTIAVSTAQCERSFSSLKRIKTYLRSTMGEDRLANLAVLSVEREISKKLCLDDVVTNFSKEDRRIILS